MNFFEFQRNTLESRGGSIIFSRGDGFPKKFGDLFFFFFSSTNQIELPQPKALQRPCFGENFSAAVKNLNKQATKGVLGTFWKFLTKKKSFFFGARSPLKISMYC